MEKRIKKLIVDEFEKNMRIFSAMASDHQLHQKIFTAVVLCKTALHRGNKILLAGNGGSAADAQHWAGELVSRFYYNRPGLPAIALTTDTSIITAIGNDYGYEKIFSRQVETLSSAGDILILISTSGNSENIIRAAQSGKERGISVIGFSGNRGGRLAPLCDLCFLIPSDETPRIQEGHEFIGHLLCALIESEIYPQNVH